VIVLVGVLIAVFVVPDQWTVPVVIAAIGVEVTETLVTMWWSRRAPPKVGVETLIGASGLVVQECRPIGRVRVRGEIWRARSTVPLDPGARVTVIGRERLTLLVEPEQETGR
jgi:membrane-bound serine protease (ClpP class)